MKKMRMKRQAPRRKKTVAQLKQGQTSRKFGPRVRIETGLTNFNARPLSMAHADMAKMMAALPITIPIRGGSRGS